MLERGRKRPRDAVTVSILGDYMRWRALAIALGVTAFTSLAAAGIPGSGAERNRDPTSEEPSEVRSGPREGDRAAPQRAERNPRVLFIVAEDCDRCREELDRLRRPGGDFEAMQARGWKIGASPENHVQIVDKGDVSDVVDLLDVHEFPSVVCVSDDQVVRYFKDGCTTPLDSWTFGWLLKGENERPKSSPKEAVRVYTTGSYPLRGNHWSVDGDWNPSREKVVSHLRGPNHVGQLQGTWNIESWAYEELRSLHDDLHEREQASNPAAFTPRAQPVRRGADNFSANRKMLGT